MGLDMFASTLKAELAPPAQLGVSVADEAVKAVGFALTQESLGDMTEDARSAYISDYRAALSRAKAEGLCQTDFAYWRKFNHLHGYMQELYRAKGGTETFNCVTVRLTKEDLQLLQAQASGLHPAQGFFFGEYSAMTADQVGDVVSFTKRALQAIEDGYAVYYDSWW